MKFIKENKDIKELIKFLLLITLFFYCKYIVLTILNLFGIVYTQDDYFLASVIDVIQSIILIVILVIVHRKTLKEDLKKLIKNKNGLLKFFGYIVIGYIILINIEIVCSIIERLIAFIFSINMGTSNNQELVETIIHSSPIIMVISACLLAPLEEELLFRGSIRKTIKNKGVFIAVSGLFFGLLHITGNYILLILLIISAFIISKIMSSNNKNKIWLSVITAVISIAIFIVSMIIVKGSIITYIYSIDPNELLNGITYISLGCYFAAIYAYTDNIYYTIGIHMITNTVASLLLLLK